MTDTNEVSNNTTRRVEQIAGIALVAFLVLGCMMVLRFFLSSMLWAAILCYSTWPVFTILKRALRGRATLAALLMVIMTALLLVAPFVLVTLSLRENVAVVTHQVDKILHEGLPPPPPWIEKIPLAGKSLDEFWKKQVAKPVQPRTTPQEGSLAQPEPQAPQPPNSLAPMANAAGVETAAVIDPNAPEAAATPVVAEPSGPTLVDQLRQFIIDSRGTLLKHGVGLAQVLLEGVVQLSLSIFIAFFFYRDGDKVVNVVASSITRVAGNQTQKYLTVVGKTVRGVVYGIIGTAVAQGMVATLGFLLVGAGSPLMLGVLTFFLALIVPAGPPMVWGGVAAWLFANGQTGWGVFMIVYGLLVISGIDNVVRPYIISRGTNLPFVLVFFGVLGGVLTFGFLGFFLGPVLLVMGYGMLSEWISVRRQQVADATPSDDPAEIKGSA